MHGFIKGTNSTKKSHTTAACLINAVAEKSIHYLEAIALHVMLQWHES